SSLAGAPVPSITRTWLSATTGVSTLTKARPGDRAWAAGPGERRGGEGELVLGACRGSGVGCRVSGVGSEHPAPCTLNSALLENVLPEVVVADHAGQPVGHRGRVHHDP